MNAASVTVLPRRTPPSILVVETDVRIRCLVSDALRALDFKVLEASSADDALTVLEAMRIDLLFVALDLSGGRSALDVARLVRTRRMPTRIILASDGVLAKTDADDFGPFCASPMRRPRLSSSSSALSTGPRRREPREEPGRWNQDESSAVSFP